MSKFTLVTSVVFSTKTIYKLVSLSTNVVQSHFHLNVLEKIF